MSTNFVATFAILSTPPSFDTLAFQSGSKDSNFDFTKLIGNGFSTLYTNLVKFGLVTPQLIRRECVQQASITTGVSLTTFARQRHC